MLFRQHFPGGIVANYLLNFLFHLMEYFIHPSVWCCDHLFSLFLPTSEEKKQPFIVISKVVILTMPYICVTLVFLPLFIVGVLIRIPLHLIRSPYIFLEKWTKYTRQKYQNHKVGDTFSILTANVCLLPEFLSRFNNLSHSSYRAKEMGQRIVIDQLFYDQSNSERIELPPSLNYLLERHRIKQRSQRLNTTANNSASISAITCTTLVASIMPHFQQLDFLCFQECWSTSLSRRFVRELHRIYPYVVYDIGTYSFDTNCYCYNSGLMFASKYKIVEIEFKSFPNDSAEGRFDSKGLLMIKIQVSEHCTGYVSVCHLQAYQGKKKIIVKQLDFVQTWISEFKTNTIETHDVLLFDVICGDFNFDNMSPCDKACAEHELFNKYEDVARVRPGEDKSWAIGTELRQQSMYESDVSYPDTMKRALQNPLKRQDYVIDACLKQGTMMEILQQKVKVDSRGGNPVVMPYGGKRRIDYILCRNNIPLNIEKYNFITRLATLTDHIPISMTFRVRP